MSETEAIEKIERKLDSMTAAFIELTKAMGTRLNRDQMCQRLKIHRNTLAKRMEDNGFPQPGADGKWLLSEVIEWERPQ